MQNTLVKIPIVLGGLSGFDLQGEIQFQSPNLIMAGFVHQIIASII